MSVDEDSLTSQILMLLPTEPSDTGRKMDRTGRFQRQVVFAIALAVAAVALLTDPSFFYGSWSLPFVLFILFGWMVMIVLSVIVGLVILVVRSRIEIETGLLGSTLLILLISSVIGRRAMAVLLVMVALFALAVRSRTDIETGVLATALLTPGLLFVVLFWMNFGVEYSEVGVIDFTPTRAALLAMLRAVGGGTLVWMVLPLTTGSLLADRLDIPLRYLVGGWSASLILGLLVYLGRSNLMLENGTYFGPSRTFVFGLVWLIVIVGPGIGGLAIDKVTS